MTTGRINQVAPHSVREDRFTQAQGPGCRATHGLRRDTRCTVRPHCTLAGQALQPQGLFPEHRDTRAKFHTPWHRTMPTPPKQLTLAIERTCTLSQRHRLHRTISHVNSAHMTDMPLQTVQLVGRLQEVRKPHSRATTKAS